MQAVIKRRVPAGYITRVKADNSLSNEPINRYDTAQRKFVATPIVKKSGETLFLILYGTGFRTALDSDGNAANGVAENVEVTIGGVKADVAYAGLSGYIGVEQLNIKLPSDVVAGASITVLMPAFFNPYSRLIFSLRHNLPVAALANARAFIVAGWRVIQVRHAASSFVNQLPDARHLLKIDFLDAVGVDVIVAV